MSGWGRSEQVHWPSRRPVWSLAVLWLALVAMPVAGWLTYRWEASPLQKFYLPMYLHAGFTNWLGIRWSGPARLLKVVDRRGKTRLAINADIESARVPPGYLPFQLTPVSLAYGSRRLVYAPPRRYANRWLYWMLRRWVYQGEGWGDLARGPFEAGLAFAVLGLLWAIPKDIRRARVRRYGRRLKGPELVTAEEFGRRLKGDGIAFADCPNRFLFSRRTVWARIPRRQESSHLLIMGDSGTGKGALIRQRT